MNWNDYSFGLLTGISFMILVRFHAPWYAYFGWSVGLVICHFLITRVWWR